MRTPYQITAPHFVAGIEVADNTRETVARAAPIIGYMIGWPLARVMKYCARRNWKLERVA